MYGSCLPATGDGQIYAPPPDEALALQAQCGRPPGPPLFNNEPARIA